MSFVIKSRNNLFVAVAVVEQFKDVLNNSSIFLIDDRATNDSCSFVPILSLDNLSLETEGRAKDQMALKGALFQSLHDFPREVSGVKLCHADQKMLHEEILWSIGADHRFSNRDEPHFFAFEDRSSG